MLRNRYLDLEAFIVDDCYSCCYMVPSFFFFDKGGYLRSFYVWPGAVYGYIIHLEKLY